MRLVGMMLARNEEWVIGASARAALAWVDELDVLDHASTDGTRETLMAIKVEYRGRVRIYDWPASEHWMEMDARQWLLQLGRSNGGTHFAIIDADEILTANLLGRVGPWVASLKPRECLDLPMIAPWKGLSHYSTETRGVVTLAFHDAPDLGWAPRGEEEYHHHSRPPHRATARISPLADSDEGGVFHLQWANWERMVWKHRHYMMTERIRWGYPPSDINQKYHWWEKPPRGRCLRPLHAEWLVGHPIGRISLGGEPWYKAECETLWKKHGAQVFEGLDLFGWQGCNTNS